MQLELPFDMYKTTFDSLTIPPKYMYSWEPCLWFLLRSKSSMKCNVTFKRNSRVKFKRETYSHLLSTSFPTLCQNRCVLKHTDVYYY